MNGELNDLTRRLYAQGYTREHHPDTVYWSDWQNFGYKWETMLGFTWEAPCGLQIQGSSDVGRGFNNGDCWFQNVWYCPENDNPLLRCPYQRKGCEHIPQGFPLIMCPCHQTDRPYDYGHSVEKIETENAKEAHKQYMELTGGAYCACVMGNNGYEGGWYEVKYAKRGIYRGSTVPNMNSMQISCGKSRISFKTGSATTTMPPWSGAGKSRAKSSAMRTWAARPWLWGFSKPSRRRRPKQKKLLRKTPGERPSRLRAVRSLTPGGKIFKNTK